jgi:hypothetical protein
MTATCTQPAILDPTRQCVRASRNSPDWLTALAAQWRSGQRTREERKLLLQKLQRGLSDISTSTEGLFLLVGERLMGLQVRAREIAGRTSSISDLLSNDDDSPAVLEDLLTAAQRGAQANQVEVRIREIQQNAKSIHHAIEALSPIANTFYVLGVSTRIESACFEAGATFLDLAEAVTALSRRIRAQLGNTADSAAALLETASQAAEIVRIVAQKRREDLGPLVRQTSAELVKIKDHRSRISEAAKHLAARFGAVSRAVGDVVIALQSHDIVRQQIEHVVDALRQIEKTDDSESNVLEAARLQAALLDNSRITFESSIRQIIEALAQIELNIEEVADESAHLLGMSETNEGSFFSSVKADLAAILAILESNAAADRLLSGAAGSVQRRISEISQTVADVHAIGGNMQFIALNATIQAVRLGQDGAALKIVAETIRQLAREAECTAETLESRLSAVRDASSVFREETGAGSGWDEQIAQLRERIEALTSIQDEARCDYTRTVELTAGLKRQIQETIAAFGNQNDCLEVLSGATAILRQFSADGAPADRSGMPQMAAIYTMHSERAVHRAVCGDDSQIDGFSQAAALPDPGDDNVEFF